MKLKKIPGSDLVVSEICLGTMTFGEQLTKEQSFAQLDKATKELGINFIVRTP
jgi:aryl-alcohol dehydrogenase-like predicted oxidoreductase